MKFFTLPQALYSHENIRKIFYDSQSCILFKKLDENLLSREKICTSHCFIYVKKGYVEVKTALGQSIKTGAGEILFMPRDTYIISDFIATDDSIEMYLMFIEHDIVNSFLGSKMNNHQQNSADAIVCKVESNDNVAQYFDALIPVYGQFENSVDLLKIKILEFLHLIYAQNKGKLITTLMISEQHKKSRNLSTLMSENYDKNLSVADFASLSGRSLSSFNRDFRRKYGKSPKQWLIENRMIKAAQLLANGSSVTNCAMDVGYSNISHFIKSYKSIHGKTPSEMKNINL